MSKTGDIFQVNVMLALTTVVALSHPVYILGKNVQCTKTSLTCDTSDNRDGDLKTLSLTRVNKLDLDIPKRNNEEMAE